MGYSTNLLVLANQSLGDVIAVAPWPTCKLTRAHRDVDGTTAMSGAVTHAAAEIGVNLVWWDRRGELACAHYHDVYEQLSRSGPLLMAHFDSVTSNYGVSYYTAGALRRYVGYVSGQLRSNVCKGSPLDEEIDIVRPAWGYDEDWVFTLVERLFGLGHIALETATYAVLDYPD